MKLEPAYYWPEQTSNLIPLKFRRKLTKKLISQLARAQSNLWRALNIYDDFLDGAGQAVDLPTANNHYRCFLETYYRLNLSPSFYALFDQLLKDLDQTNRAEARAEKLKLKDGFIVLPKELPDFSDLETLSKKSLALASGPLAILELSELSNKKEVMDMLLDFFRLALAAKQLADDSQDWLSDLQAGKISAANSLVIKQAAIRKISLKLDPSAPTPYLLFAEIAPQISDQLWTLCLSAREEMLKFEKLINQENGAKNQLIESLIAPLEAAIIRAREFQKLML